jgi:hypothetical protein
MGMTENTATALLALNGLDVSPNSAVSVEGTEVGLAGSGQKVAILAPSGSQVISGFEGESSAASGGLPRSAVVVRQPARHAALPRRGDGDGGFQRRHPRVRQHSLPPRRMEAITCDWLAGTVLTGVVDEDEAPDMAREFANGLAKKAYGCQREPVGRA